MRKILIFGLVLGLLLFSLVALADGPEYEKVNVTGKFGGTLVWSVFGSGPKTFNYPLAQETSSTTPLGFVFSGLVGEDGVTTDIKPELAKSWDISEDGLVWTFHLRRGLKWSDGAPFTADDVVFTFNDIAYNDKIQTDWRDVLTVEGKPFKVEKVDDYTVKFTLPVPFAPFLREVGIPIMPKHKLEEAVKSGKYMTTWGVDTDPKEIVGMGPFIMKEYKQGDRIIFERNPNYWKVDKDGNKLPFLDGMVMLIVPDQDTQLLKFQSGELDHLILRGEDYAVLEPEQKKKGFTIYKSGATFGSQFVTFCWSHKDPVKRKWFNNKHFRKAVAYAIDRKSYIDNVLYGFGVEQWSPVSPAVKTFYNDKVIKYPYDLEKAKEELKKGGFVLKDNKLYDADGNPVKFEILTNSGNKAREALGTMLQEDLSNLGMEVKFSPIDFNALVKRLLARPEGDWDAVIIGLTGGVEPNGGKNVWNSKGGLHFFNYDPKNRKCWEKQVDMLFEIGAQILNTRDRKVVYDKWQYIASDELPFLYTALAVRLEAFKNYVKGAKPSSYGQLGGLWNIEEIWLDK